MALPRRSVDFDGKTVGRDVADNFYDWRISMTFTQLISKCTRQLLKARRWKPYQLARRSAIPCSTLSYVLRERNKNMKVETLVNVCRGLDMRVVDFFDDSLFEPENITDD